MTQPAIDFLTEILAAYPRVRAGDVRLPEDLVDEDDEALEITTDKGRVHVVLHRASGVSVIDIAWMQAAPPRSGAGTIVLRMLCALADKHRATIKLIPKRQDPGLVAFYERHGFVRSSAPDFLVREHR